MIRFTQLPGWTKASVVGLVLTAAGMLTQMAGGSQLYPTVTGPVVLVVTAMLVLMAPWSWTRYVGLAVPVVLGVGAVAAAAMTGEFIDQLTGTARPALLFGSITHVAGLVLAITGGIGMVLNRSAAVGIEP